MDLKTLLVKIKGSKDGKIIAENFIYLSILQIAGYVFPLITMPYLAKIIGAEGLGRIAFASAIMVWIQTVADWGFNYTATREVAKNREDKDKVSDIFSRVLWSRCFLMIVSFVLLSFLIIVVPLFKENSIVIVMTFLMIPGHIMFPDWFFQAMEKMKYITILNLASKILFTILVFIFIKSKEDYILQPLFTSMGYVLAGVIAMYYILRRWKVRLKIVSLKSIIETIKSSTDVFINNLLPNLYASLATILLGIFHGNTANGIFDAGTKFMYVAQQLLSCVTRVFFPFLSRNINKHHIYAKVSIILSLGMSLALFIFAPLLIKLFFTPEFYDAINVLRILSLVLIFITIDSVYGVNYLIVRGFDKQRRTICLICSIVGCVIAVVLVYYYSYIGKAVSLVIANAILSIVSMIYAIHIKISFRNKEYLKHKSL